MKQELKPGNLHCRLIIEIVGAPEKHVVDSLRTLLKKFKDETGVKLVNGRVHNPKKQGEFFSAFAELEVIFDDFSLLSNACFEYMPSSIEIISSEKLSVESIKISNFINDLLAKLHEINLRFASVNARRMMLEKNCSALLQNSLIVMLKDSSKTITQISKLVGLSEKQLTPFMEELIKKRIITKKGNTYALTT
jgi:hypothetical protein